MAPPKLTVTNFNAFVRRIAKEFTDQVINDIKDQVTEELQSQVGIALDPGNSPEVSSMLNGSLRGELGLTTPDKKIDSLIREIRSSISPRISNRARNSRGRTLNVAARIDVKSLVGISDGFQQTKKQRLPWLKWMLLDGNRIIVKGHKSFIARGAVAQLSRSGTGYLMTVKPKSGNNWRVPPAFSGTRNNNFITRAINKRNKAIDRALTRIVNLGINRTARRMRLRKKK